MKKNWIFLRSYNKTLTNHHDIFEMEILEQTEIQ